MSAATGDVRVELRVRGRVQGVWFRAHTREAARALGLVGRVRNVPDGTVEIVAEGPRSACEGLERWCWTGSPLSEVTTVEARWAAATAEFSDFSVELR